MYGHLGSWCIKSILYNSFLDWNKIFKKDKAVTVKTPLSVTDPFCTPHSTWIKDTHREKESPNKTPLLKSTNMDIWVVGTSNQLFMRGS